ncbi:MAG TPA: AAA family ATPase [Candidatus Paceibacterota bacterium]
MLKRLEIAGFKSFARKTVLDFSSDVTAIVGPNGSGKSNVAEAFRFALGEQSMKSMRGKKSEDLIFSGTHSAARANRAAVTIVFDNTRRTFKIDFDEVAIERAVFRDGTSEYAINGSKVRLRDIHELLANANIGESAHHIISQGEADRILLASPRERREMLEDALGLKAYEFKKQEAERKLEKTQENIMQVEALRRELAPHVRFLSKQVEKLERAEELRRELIAASQAYFAVEDAYLAQEEERAAAAKAAAAERLAAVSAELSAIEARAVRDEENEKRVQAVREAEQALERASSERTALARDIGRIEGALAAAEARKAAVSEETHVRVAREDLTALHEEVERQVRGVGEESAALRAALVAVHKVVQAFFERFALPVDSAQKAVKDDQVQKLTQERAALSAKEEALAARVEKSRHALARLREEIAAHEETGREEQRRVLSLAESKAREEAAVVRETARLAELAARRSAGERDKAELLALAGSAAVSYEPISDVPAEEASAQETRRYAIERLKIRLEETGGTGEDIRKEHEEAVAREAFLARELADLAQSAKGLRELIGSLNEELAKSFIDGLERVNASFGEFFSLMFGGGGARLALEDVAEPSDDQEGEDAPKEQSRPGIEIVAHLPKKRVQTLTQLSGGERALTSIALIFAMSQVNPPPFLILDETDAALDEANSRRYGDMITTLAKRSQLIVVTHNRETMSRAGILYGVTMGGEGISKLLSVKFEEAAAVAK